MFLISLSFSARGTLCVELLGLEEDNSVSVCELLVSLGLAREPPPPARPFLAAAQEVICPSKDRGTSSSHDTPSLIPRGAQGHRGIPGSPQYGQHYNFGYVDDDAGESEGEE